MTMRDKLHVSAGGRVLGTAPGGAARDHEELAASAAGLALLAAASAVQAAGAPWPGAGPGGSGLSYPVVPPASARPSGVVALPNLRQFFLPVRIPRVLTLGSPNRVLFRAAPFSADATVSLRWYGWAADGLGPGDAISASFNLPVTTPAGLKEAAPAMNSGQALTQGSMPILGLWCTWATTQPSVTAISALLEALPFVDSNGGGGTAWFQDSVAQGSALPATAPASTALSTLAATGSTPCPSFGWAP